MTEPMLTDNMSVLSDQIDRQDMSADLCSMSFKEKQPHTLQQQHQQQQQQQQQQKDEQGLTVLPTTENEFHEEITNNDHSPAACRGPTSTPPLAPITLPSLPCPSSTTMPFSSSTLSPPISDPTEHAAKVEPQASLPNASVFTEKSPSTRPPESSPSPLAHVIYSRPRAENSHFSEHDTLYADPPSPVLPSELSSSIDFRTSEGGAESAPWLSSTTDVAEEPVQEWTTWPAGHAPTLNVDVSPDSEAPMSSTASVASSIASSSFVSDAAISSSQEDLDGDTNTDDPDPKHHQGRRTPFGHGDIHHPHFQRQHVHQHRHQHHTNLPPEAPSAYDADEDFSGSEYSTSSCESCSRRFVPSRSNSSEFTHRTEHHDASYPMNSPPPQQRHHHQPSPSPPSSSSSSSTQYCHSNDPKPSRPASPASSSTTGSKSHSTNSNTVNGSSSKSSPKSTFSLGSLPSPSQASKMVIEFFFVSALMVTVLSAAFTFSYVVTATNHAGQKLREAIEARERSVQRALERVAGEEFVKVRRQQQQRQNHYTAQKQTSRVDDDRLSPAEWQELIHAAVYGLVSKWIGQDLTR